jgi:beta-mannan synthase
MDPAARGGGHSIAEEAARLWADFPVRVDWAAVAAQCASLWAHARALVLVPAVRLLVFLSLAMTVMILLEKLFVCAVCLAVRAFRLGPHRRYRWEPITAAGSNGAAAGDDEESGGGGHGEAKYPMVLVQIPMYNEREVSGRGWPIHEHERERELAQQHIACWRRRVLVDMMSW